jgi:copper(I)-binding protein
VSRALLRTAALLAVPTLALTGCGAGFEAQTYQQRVLADSANAAAGSVAVRGVSVLPGDDGMLEAGDDAEVVLTLTNEGQEDDRLVDVSSPLADSVDIVDVESGRTASSLRLPAFGTTGSRNGLVLRSLSEDLRSGEYAELTLRFERGGELTLSVPVAVTGEYDDSRERSDNFHPPGSDEEH